ncbi:TusE/DsrC/DsvC family sulfur relay protein [candidate division KSB1 bacterium]|nr:TusE/DsrC/DsvC family sulfur relay protein [candidate division KSB1 bacterium]
MSTKVIANVEVEIDTEGFMTNPDQWTKEIASAIAKEEGVELTEAHWKVINFIRKDYSEKGTAPSIRRINKVGGISTKDMYNLFPDGPAKKAAKISGLGKPQGCV